MSMTVTVDKYTRLLLTVIAVLLSVVALGLWCQTPDTLKSAHAAGIPNQGLQLDETVQQLIKVNASLERMNDLLVSGDIKVQVLESQNGKDKEPVVVTPKVNDDQPKQ
jgi:hypothetical protein